MQFRLHLLEERDWEQDYSQIPIELKFTLSSKWAVSAFGVPSLYKAEDDVGAAVYFAPNSEWEYRLSGVWGDFQRNQRNLDSDRWATAPMP